VKEKDQGLSSPGGLDTASSMHSALETSPGQLTQKFNGGRPESSLWGLSSTRIVRGVMASYREVTWRENRKWQIQHIAWVPGKEENGRRMGEGIRAPPKRYGKDIWL